MKWSARCSLFLAALALVVSLAAALRSGFRADKPRGQPHLISGLPDTAEGWFVKDQPIAASPEMQRAVDEMLNYDEAVFRTYSRNGLSFSVYAAAWAPGKFHPRLIAIHTPDACWVGNGMRMVGAGYGYRLELNGRLFWPAQYREFEANGDMVYVLYWHILDGYVSGFADGPKSRSRAFVSDAWRDITRGIGEQYFVRISSNMPVEMWKREPLMGVLMQHFSAILEEKVK